MTDPDGAQAVAEYYVLRIYRRNPGGQQDERGSLVGVIEDTQGNQRAFRDIEELWQALAGGTSQRHETKRSNAPAS